MNQGEKTDLCEKKDCILHGNIRVGYRGDEENTDIAFVGESPGIDEELMGSPFFGRSGQLLMEQASKAGLAGYNAMLLNSAMCRIPKDTLKIKEINSILNNCRSHLEDVLKRITPKVIVALGALAAQQLLKVKTLGEVRGTFVWSDEFNCYVFPTYHPAFCLRKPSSIDLLAADFYRLKTFLVSGGTVLDKDEILIEERESIRDIINSATVAAVDTETQGLDYINPSNIMLSYSVSHDPKKAYQVFLHEECGEADKDFYINWERGKGKNRQWVQIPVKRSTNFDTKLDDLRDLLESNTIKKVMMNGNYDIHHILALFRNNNRPIPQINNYTVDVQLLGHILNENIYARSSLELLRKSFTTLSTQYSDKFGNAFDKGDMLSVPREELAKYAAADACVTLNVAYGLAKAINREPEKDKQLFYFQNMVMPVTQKVILTMEENGVSTDINALPAVREELQKEIDFLYTKIIGAIPKSIKEKYIDKRSPEAPLTKVNMIKEMLYSKEGLGIPMVKNDRHEEQNSVDKKIRTELLSRRINKKAAAFIQDYDRWKMIDTLLSRYISGIEKATRIDGKIHPSFSLAVAATGRTSSANPNLQNIPKRGPIAKSIRKLFIAPPGYRFISADASQCLVPETEIYTIDGVKTLKEVIENKHPVLSLSKDYNFEFKDIVNGWCSGVNEVFEMVLDDGSKVVATAQHKFYDFYGNVKTLGELREGDRLLHMHLNRMEKQYPEISLGLDRTRGLGGHTNIRIHKVVANYLNGGTVRSDQLVHHKDHDKDNWIRDNIKVCESNSDHIKLFHSKGEKNANYGNRKGKSRLCPVCGMEFYKPPSKDNQKTCSRKCGDISFPPSLRPRGKVANHKIVSITSIGYKETYQIEVADNHNYILANGLVSKNCELRWMAFLSQEPTMLDVYNTGGDIHATTALAISGKSREELTQEEFKIARQSSKAINFGFIYGAGWRTFQRVAKLDYGLELSDKEAQVFRKVFFDTYPAIKEYHSKVIRECHSKGYVISPLGRVRHLPEVNSFDDTVVRRVERQALNHAIQSVASDTVLLSCLEIMRVSDPSECTPVLFIHDELTFLCKEDLVDKYANLIRYHMVNPPLEQFGIRLNIPLGSDCKVGTNLAEMNDYII